MNSVEKKNASSKVRTEDVRLQQQHIISSIAFQQRVQLVFMMRTYIYICMLLLSLAAGALARPRDYCDRQPTINGLCVTSTLGIYYDRDTQRCKYMGCSPDKRIFATLEDCEKICNNNRHRRRRIQN